MIFSLDTYSLLKLFYIISAALWLAFLFFLVRLYIYDQEDQTDKEKIKNVFNEKYILMEERLSNSIKMPGNIIDFIIHLDFYISSLHILPRYGSRLNH